MFSAVTMEGNHSPADMTPRERTDRSPAGMKSAWKITDGRRNPRSRRSPVEKRKEQALY
jgi:hypothetical protein